MDKISNQFTRATIFSAASAIVAAVVMLMPLAFKAALPASTLLPSRRTTSGIGRPVSLAAAMTPSQAVLVRIPLMVARMLTPQTMPTEPARLLPH
jgi:hypothetical protein